MYRDGICTGREHEAQDPGHGSGCKDAVLLLCSCGIQRVDILRMWCSDGSAVRIDTAGLPVKDVEGADRVTKPPYDIGPGLLFT